MPFTPYRLMSPEQATAALEEFLAERPAAWVRLRVELSAHGTDPDPLLDALQVHAPDWHAEDLERWLNEWMKAVGAFIR